MDNNRDFDWSEPAEDLPGDSLNRSEHAKFLTTFIVDKAKQGSYVININSGWGTGKTWFLRRWENSLCSTYPTVYVDCWKNDHSNDPFLTVIAEIQKCLISKTEVKIIENVYFKSVWKLLKDMAPVATKTILKNKFGLDFDAIKDVEDLDEVGEKIIETAIKTHEESNKSIDDLKKSISEWLETVTEGDSVYNNPLFVFIDELDRCRPTYAIEMLETVKHIFDIKNVVFIIATDKEQLQHSIKAIYGSGFNSSKYLDRFFNRSITLNQQPLDLFITQKVIENAECFTYKDQAKTPFDLKDNDGNILSVKILSCIANFFNMDLRSTNLWLDRIQAVLKYGEKPIDLFLLSLVIATEMFENSLYLSLINQNGFIGSEWDGLLIKYNNPVSFPNLKLDTKALPIDQYAIDPEILNHKKTISQHPFHYLRIMFGLMKEKVSYDDVTKKYIELYERIRNYSNHQNRPLDYTGTKYHLANGSQISFDLRNEIAILQFNLKYNLYIKDYIQYCDLAVVLE